MLVLMSSTLYIGGRSLAPKAITIRLKNPSPGPLPVRRSERRFSAPVLRNHQAVNVVTAVQFSSLAPSCLAGALAKAGSDRERVRVRAEATGRLQLTAGGKFLPEVGPHPHAEAKRFEAEFFIGRMRVVIRQGQAQKQRIGSQNPFELRDDRNRSSFPHQ